MKNLFQILQIVLPKFAKNLLVFFPVIISSKEFDLNIFTDLSIGFFIFCITTMVVYLTNDYLDRDLDKNNILKKNKNLSFGFNSKIIITANVLLFLFLILTFYLSFFYYSLLIYILLFYFYTFIGKKIKFLDLILLNSFYICRLLYGCEIVDIKISTWFIVFFFSLFILLSVFKRYIQVSKNNLSTSNKIIPYSMEDLKMFKILINICFSITIIIMLLFIFQENIYNIQLLSSSDTNLEFNKFNYLLILMIYIINIFMIYFNIMKNKVGLDIFDYVLKNRINIISAFIILILLIIN